jgi:acyl-CoA thioesterase-1
MLRFVESVVSLRLVQFAIASGLTLRGSRLEFGGTAADSLPPCGGGLGWGVVPWGTEVPHRTTPTPNPSPQGGGEEIAAPSRLSFAPRSYGRCGAGVQMPARRIALAAVVFCGVLSAALSAAMLAPARGSDGPVRIVALGDSLTAGFGLPAPAAFPVRLEKALAAKGIAVAISNAGVSGDTMSDGLARLDWSVPEGTQAVILELGANDMLRGLDPRLTRKTLEEILRRLGERHIEVLLCGMLAAPNLGADYAQAFNGMFSELAASRHLIFYPFFLDGVLEDRQLVQPDGLHPTAAGVDVIVARVLPKAEELVARVRSQHAD